ncbi:MAG: LapA family protein [Magnetococcales bacterium]|nr:LapA family protein [Magnetococcales bacterium]
MRSTLSLLFAVLLLIFASQNTHEAQVRFIFGPPVAMPLILIMAGAFVAGFAVATLGHLVKKLGRSQFRNED